MFAIRFFPPPAPLALAASLALAACSSLPADRGRGEVDAALAARGLATPAAAAPEPLQAWLAEPLTPDRAIQIALLHNPELRAETAHLGLAAADVYEAGRLANPVLSATWLSPGDEPQAQLTLGLALNFTDLLLMRSRSRIAAAQFDSVKLAVGSATLDLAARVEAAYRRVAAAEQLVQLKATLQHAAQSSAELARRYRAAGNLSLRDLALEEAAATQAALDADAAALDLTLARSDLNRLLGLPAGDGHWTLAEPLALPPAQEPALDTLLQRAQDARLDLAAARRHADAVAARYGLTRRTRALGEIELGAEREREYDGSVHGGPTLSLALPLFDWGRGRVARGEAELQIAEAGLAARELDAGNEVKAAYARVAGARQRAERYRRELIPAREAVVTQMQREFNYMLVGVFELLAARQQGYDAYAGYLEALRDYWVARAELARAVGSRLPDDAPTPAALQFDALRPRLGDTADGPAASADVPRATPHDGDAHAAPADAPADAPAHAGHAAAAADSATDGTAAGGCDMPNMDRPAMSAGPHDTMMADCANAAADEHGAHHD
ncbi:TolC family protein [Solimonas flava]|uniref:TolC family protein n=1 Tax=Solimonas flava TaxID=415849 RepID=UPI0004048C78|nr:TolC family protein [Solimonas flava]